jgi:hypothetical protein
VRDVKNIFVLEIVMKRLSVILKNGIHSGLRGVFLDKRWQTIGYPSTFTTVRYIPKPIAIHTTEQMSTKSDMKKNCQKFASFLGFAHV